MKAMKQIETTASPNFTEINISGPTGIFRYNVFGSDREIQAFVDAFCGEEEDEAQEG